MKLNYADRKTDKNILKKKFKMMDITDGEFSGKISLIEIEDLKKNFESLRPNGKSELVIAKDFKIMMYFPIKEKYSMTVMFDESWNLLQWYFDINRYSCKYDSGIPYNEDLYLDVIALPNGEYYTLDEDELDEALKRDLISKEEFDMAYETRNKIIQMIKNDFDKLKSFTQKSLDKLIHE